MPNLWVFTQVPPLMMLNSAQAVTGVLGKGLTTGTHGSHSYPWSGARVCDTCAHRTTCALYAMQITHRGRVAGTWSSYKAIAVWQKEMMGLHTLPGCPEPG